MATCSRVMTQPQFVLAVLLVDGRYVMQLRDDKPGIAAPGVWGLFGGSVEVGEEPRVALLREVEEELCIKLNDCHFLWSVEHRDQFAATTVGYWLFEADITELWGQHRLTEGQCAQHFSFEELCDLTMPPLIRQALERHRTENPPLNQALFRKNRVGSI